MKLQERADDLWQLRFRGELSRLEHKLCSFLLACTRCREWSDVDLCWVLDVSEERLAACREALAAKGLLRFATGHEPGYVTYQVLSATEKVRQREPRRKLTGFPPPRQRWIVFEQGKQAHILRDDDLFAAERTLCGIPALDADWHPLPRLNSQPADYPVCQRCHHLHSQP